MFKAPKDITYPQGKYFRMEVTIGQNNAGIKFLRAILIHGHQHLVLI